MAQLIDLIVDGRVLLDVGVRLRDVGFGLVVVVVADKVADVVVGKEGLELARKLRRECLVVCNDERWALHALNDLCHRIGLARPRRAEQHLRRHAVFNAARKICNRLRLIAHRLKGCDDLERNLLLEDRCIEFRNHRHRTPSFALQKNHSVIISHSTCDENSAKRKSSVVS